MREQDCNACFFSLSPPPILWHPELWCFKDYLDAGLNGLIIKSYLDDRRLQLIP